jgi:D-alanyl-D-alanine carboxypeptidase
VPSHRADTPPLRRPRQNRSAPGRLTPAGSATAGSARRRAPGRAKTPSLSAPQVGIAGALGIATIAAPLSGAMAGPAPEAAVNTFRQSQTMSAAPAAIPAFPALPGSTGAVGTFNPLPNTAGLDAEASTPSLLAAPRTVIVTRASRSGERSILPGCDGVAKVTSAPNGQIPAGSLCTLWDPKHRLRADAAVSVAKMNMAYQQRFGENICLTDSYRTISEQYRLRSIKPGLAAVPGTSEHGWGLAVDLCDGVQKGPGNSRYQWLRDHAADYGWSNPAWAVSGGTGPYEPWHWEFVAGE